MIEELGEVIGIDDGRVHVRTQSKTTCNACHAKHNCGSGMVAQALAGQVHEFWVDSDKDDIQVGQHVWLGIAEESVLHASLWLYVLPLLSLVISVVSVMWWWPLAPEIVQIVIGLMALVGTFFYVKRRFADGHDLSLYKPILLRVKS